MQLSTYFSLDEFTDSDTAARQNIDNDLPLELVGAARETCEMLDRIREHLGQPVILTSGYRCLRLNRSLGSKDTSDHLKAMAGDIKSPKYGSPYKIAKALEPKMQEFGIGQMILEFGRWVHVSRRAPTRDVNRLLTYTSTGKLVGIHA